MKLRVQKSLWTLCIFAMYNRRMTMKQKYAFNMSAQKRIEKSENQSMDDFGDNSGRWKMSSELFCVDGLRRKKSRYPSTVNVKNIEKTNKDMRFTRISNGEMPSHRLISTILKYVRTSFLSSWLDITAILMCLVKFEWADFQCLPSRLVSLRRRDDTLEYGGRNSIAFLSNNRPHHSTDDDRLFEKITTTKSKH
jgi:hypothetical protein